MLKISLITICISSNNEKKARIEFNSAFITFLLIIPFPNEDERTFFFQSLIFLILRSNIFFNISNLSSHNENNPAISSFIVLPLRIFVSIESLKSFKGIKKFVFNTLEPPISVSPPRLFFKVLILDFFFPFLPFLPFFLRFFFVCFIKILKL